MRSVAVVALLILAGCAGAPSAFTGTVADGDGLPARWVVNAEGCYTTAVFFLVDESRAHPFLPPGFHAGDLSAFLYNTAVTSARVPAFVATSKCERIDFTDGAANQTSQGALEVVYVGFFIQPPEMGSAYANKPSDYNFYAVSYLTPLDDGTVATQVPSDVAALYGWNQTKAQSQLLVKNLTAARPAIDDPTMALPDRMDYLTGQGNVSIAGEEIFSFGAHAMFPQSFTTPPSLRFWQAAPAGIGFMEFNLSDRTLMAGPLDDCTMAPGTIIHAVAGDRVGSNGGKPCGMTESFAIVFDEHTLAGGLHHLEGVHPI